MYICQTNLLWHTLMFLQILIHTTFIYSNNVDIQREKKNHITYISTFLQNISVFKVCIYIICEIVHGRLKVFNIGQAREMLYM